MQRFRSAYAVIGLLSLSLIFAGCKKQLHETQSETATVAVAGSNVGCKPTVFGATIEFPNGVRIWRTLMQKWYGSDGRLAYLQTSLGYDFDTYDANLMTLPWGELSYPNANQVYLKDVLRNRNVMRATIDAQRKPLASYFSTDEGPNKPKFIDTSYYSYTGDRLDQIISISQAGPTMNPPLFKKYSLTYDMYGNVIRIQTGSSAGAYMMHLQYDYTQPIADMLPVHMLDMQYTLLEYMDLLHLPVHHKLVEVVSGQYTPGTPYPNEVYPVGHWRYNNYQLLANNLVYSYMNPVRDNYTKKTFYTGWECGASQNTDPTNRQKTTINSLEDFQKLYPATRK